MCAALLHQDSTGTFPAHHHIQNLQRMLPSAGAKATQGRTNASPFMAWSTHHVHVPSLHEHIYEGAAFGPSASTCDLANACQALITNHQHQHPIPCPCLNPALCPTQTQQHNIALCPTYAHKALPVPYISSLCGWDPCRCDLPAKGVTSTQQHITLSLYCDNHSWPLHCRDTTPQSQTQTITQQQTHNTSTHRTPSQQQSLLKLRACWLALQNTPPTRVDAACQTAAWPSQRFPVSSTAPPA